MKTYQRSKQIVLDHGLVIEDEYYWLRDDSKLQKHPKILEFIAKENANAQDYIKNNDIAEIEVIILKLTFRNL